jgi:hypothetical protein
METQQMTEFLLKMEAKMEIVHKDFLAKLDANQKKNGSRQKIR